MRFTGLKLLQLKVTQAQLTLLGLLIVVLLIGLCSASLFFLLTQPALTGVDKAASREDALRFLQILLDAVLSLVRISGGLIGVAAIVVAPVP